MKQIEISDNGQHKGGRLYQTFYIDMAADFKYYRPLYLVIAEDEKDAARAGKNQYFLDHMTQIRQSEWKQRVKEIKVIARVANHEKDKAIFTEVEQFNNAKNIPSRTASEVAHRIAEENIHNLILSY